MTAVYIIADLEGSTGCLQRSDAQLFNDGWVHACVELSHDINLIGRRLLHAGARRVRVKDFHRTGFNLFRELIDRRIELEQGYQAGPVPGLGDVSGFDCLMMTGMHAVSGSDGFLPHTLTSRFAAIEVNGLLLSEAELFAASVASAGLAVVFFSGCPIACGQAIDKMPWLQSFIVSKPLADRPEILRQQIADAAAQAFMSTAGQIYQPTGPFATRIKMRDGESAAARLRKMWRLDGNGNELSFSCPDMQALYLQMIRLAYLSPFIEAHLAFSLKVANISGRLTHMWARRRAIQKNLLPISSRETKSRCR
ncbi:MAG TPA: M55 family metallopeptidase [Candidatus Rifleibacterium sp.]|nr:M55 family metallopeptidase [Candidatus Rifleibacterium sp.]HPT44459.1 M55 family metallopeptidase [Candidatus Rifleibacterium sp.]